MDIFLMEESCEAIRKLPDADAGALIKALINGSGEGLPPMADLVFPMIKGQVDRMNDLREKRSAAGRIGGSKTKANVKQNEANAKQSLSPIPIPKPIERNTKERNGVLRSKKVQATMGFSTERDDVDYDKIAWEKMWEEG